MQLTRKERKALKEGKARDLFENKSERAKKMDRSKTSKIVHDKPNEEWVKATNKSDVKGIDTPISSKKETSQSLKEEKEEKEAEKESIKVLTALSKKIKGKEWNRSILHEDGVKGLMDKKRISLFYTPKLFEKSHFPQMYGDNAKEVKIEDSLLDIEGLNLYGFESGEKGRYVKERVDEALKHIENPEIYYRKDYPLLIKGDNLCFLISPRFNEEDEFEPERVLIPYKKYEDLKKLTKKQLAHKMGLDISDPENLKGYKDPFIYNAYKHEKETKKKIPKQVKETKEKLREKHDNLVKIQKRLSNANWVELDLEDFDSKINQIMKMEAIRAKNKKINPRFTSKEDVLKALEKGSELRYGSDWYESIRIKPKPISTKQQEFNELVRQYWALDGKIMDSEEPSIPSKLHEKSEKLAKKINEINPNYFGKYNWPRKELNINDKKQIEQKAKLPKEFKTKGSFQMKNEKYSFQDVFKQVVSTLESKNEEEIRKRATDKYNKLLNSVPPQWKMYAKTKEEYLESMGTGITRKDILKDEYAEVIQEAFKDAIHRRIKTHRATSVSNFDEINEDILLKNLNSIRNVRKHQVGREWKQRH